MNIILLVPIRFSFWALESGNIFIFCDWTFNGNIIVHILHYASYNENRSGADPEMFYGGEAKLYLYLRLSCLNCNLVHKSNKKYVGPWPPL